jgi:hypothetical protein
MKRTMTALGMAAAACWVLSGGVHAQSTTGSQSGSTMGSSQSGSMQSPAGKAGKTVRLTGCLQADPGGNGYMLTNVMESEKSSSSGYGSGSSGSMSEAGQSGTSGSTTGSGEQSATSGTSGSANGVELIGKNTELKSMVGQRVEITGVPSGKSSKMSGGVNTSGSEQSGTSGSSSGTSGSEESGAMSGSSSSMSGSHNWMGQKIRVESVRQVATSCSAQ